MLPGSPLRSDSSATRLLLCVFFVCVKRLRKRTHAHLLRGVQVFACALCVSCVPPCACACANSLRCASFCMCIVCLDVCGVCLGTRAHAQTPCGVQVFVCALLLRRRLNGQILVRRASFFCFFCCAFYMSRGACACTFSLQCVFFCVCFSKSVTVANLSFRLVCGRRRPKV